MSKITLKEKLEKAEGALEMALEHLGYIGADHDGFCRDGYECNVYGDELLRCDVCSSYLVNTFEEYMTIESVGISSKPIGCEDEDCCNFYGDEEE
tara:strand:- start:173 stop:457 length:285 start_codon:yes stop_codon:yes gene_type:complete